MATLQSTNIIVFLGRPTLSEMQEVGAQMLQLAARNPAGIYGYNVIAASAKMPDADARADIQQGFERLRGKLLASAAVIETTGIAGTLARTLVSTLLTVSKRPFTLRVFADRASAATWLAGQPGAPSAADLVGIAGTIERKLKAADGGV